MCITEFNKDVYEAGIREESKEQGRREGRQEGRREGRREGRQDVLDQLLKEGIITPEQVRQYASSCL